MTTLSSGERSAQMAGRRSPGTSRSARVRRTRTTRATASTTAITRGCRSTAGSRTQHGPTTRTVRGTTRMGPCASWTSTRPQLRYTSAQIVRPVRPASIRVPLVQSSPLDIVHLYLDDVKSKSQGSTFNEATDTVRGGVSVGGNAHPANDHFNAGSNDTLTGSSLTAQ